MVVMAIMKLVHMAWSGYIIGHPSPSHLHYFLNWAILTRVPRARSVT